MKKISKHQLIDIVFLSVIVALMITLLIITSFKQSKAHNNPTTKKAAYRETVYIVNITHVYHSEKKRYIDFDQIRETDVEWYSSYKFTLKTSDGELEVLSEIFPKVEEKKGKKYYVTLQYQNGEYFFPNRAEESAYEYWENWVWDQQ